MRNRLDDVSMRDSTIMNGNRFGILSQTLTGTTTIPDDAPQVLALDPGGSARTVKMPPTPQTGDFYILINTADAAEIITVQDNAGVGLTPACTPTQSETAILVYIDATLGWRNLVAIGV